MEARETQSDILQKLTKWEYDDQGREIACVTSAADGTIRSERKTVYADDGTRTVTTISYHDNGQPSSTMTERFDAQDRLLESLQIANEQADIRKEIRHTYQYSERGKEEHYDEIRRKDETVLSHTRRHHIYDTSGRMLASIATDDRGPARYLETLYDARGNPITYALASVSPDYS